MVQTGTGHAPFSEQAADGGMQTMMRSDRSRVMSRRRRETEADIEEDKRLHAMKMKANEERRMARIVGAGKTSTEWTPTIFTSPTGYAHPSMHGQMGAVSHSGAAAIG